MIRRSHSLPELSNEQNQYQVRMSTPQRVLVRTRSLENLNVSPWDMDGSEDNDGRPLRVINSRADRSEAMTEYRSNANTAANSGPNTDSEGPVRVVQQSFNSAAANSGPNTDFERPVRDFKQSFNSAAANSGPNTTPAANSGSNTVHRSTMGTVCDAQDRTDSNHLDTGAIPKTRNRRILPLVLGLNATSDQMNETPVGIFSPKRRLFLSPETPKGRSRKYSIGDALGASRSGEVSGVIELDGRYAFPSMEETVEGLESLNLTSNLLDEDKPNRQEEVPKQVGDEGLEPLRVRANIGRRNRRGRGAKKPSLTPGQKLITNMFRRDGSVEFKGETEKKK